MNRRPLAFLFVCTVTASMMTGCQILDKKEERLTVGTTDQLTFSTGAPYPLDPAVAYDIGAWNVMRNVFQTLLRVSMPMGGSTPTPDAAEECHFKGPSKTIYSCTLRDDLKFPDDSRVTAGDVKYSIDRVLRIRQAGGPFGLLTNISKTVAQDDRHVTFNLKRPDATFPYKLSTPAASIVSKKHYAASSPRRGFAIDGSGPYTATVESDGNQGNSVAFRVNPKYRGSIQAQNSGIDLRFFSNSEEMGQALEKAEIDVMTRTLSPAQVRSLQWREDDSIELYESPGLETRFLAFNSKSPAVARKSIRQAMALVIDRARIVQKVYPETAKTLHSIVPTNLLGHVNSFFNKYGEPDIERAADTLAADKVSLPVRITLDYTTDHYGSATTREFQEIQRQLNESGLFQVDIRGSEWSRFSKDRTSGKYSAYGMGWFPDYPDADGIIAPFLGEHNDFDTKSGSHINGVLIPEEQGQTDRTHAIGALERIQNEAAENVWFLPLWQARQYVAAQDYVTGLEQVINTSADLQLWELQRGQTSD